MTSLGYNMPFSHRPINLFEPANWPLMAVGTGCQPTSTSVKPLHSMQVLMDWPPVGWQWDVTLVTPSVNGTTCGDSFPSRPVPLVQLACIPSALRNCSVCHRFEGQRWGKWEKDWVLPLSPATSTSCHLCCAAFHVHFVILSHCHHARGERPRSSPAGHHTWDFWGSGRGAMG